MSRRKPEWYTCPDCGQPVFRRRRHNTPTRCYDCVAARMIDAARQMSDKQGPMWDAWCASNADGAPGRTDRATRE